MQATEIIFEEIERIRMHASAGLSVFQNLDLLTGYDLARSHLEAIERAVVAIDCAKDLAIPVVTHPRHCIARPRASCGD